MAIVSIRLNEDEEIIEEYAKLYNMKPGEFMKNVTLQYIEDEFDLAKADASYLEYESNPTDTSTLEELINELGLENEV